MGLDFLPAMGTIQLDIVGFLAILGEGSVLQHAQVGFLSKWSYVPRLIPAPQALIRTERPERLKPASERKVVGSHSGNVRDNLNHVAHVLHEEGDKLEAYSIQVVSLEEDKSQPAVKAKGLSPITGLALLGSLMSAGLLAFSIAQNDGFSTVATILLSSLSSLIGIGSKWELKLPERPNKEDEVPPSDVIISYSHGAFLVIKCDENTARRLYWAPEKCLYNVSTEWYRFISLLGTLLLMGGVITLANSKVESQIAWAVVYVILNAAYWVVAALPSRWNWELSSFKLHDVKTTHIKPFHNEVNGASGVQRGDVEIRSLSRAGTDIRKPGSMRPEPKAQDNVGGKNQSFTDALWHAIAITKSSQWARNASVAPSTDGWNHWLTLAQDAAQATVFVEEHSAKDGGVLVAEVRLPKWNARGNLQEILSSDPKRPAVKKQQETV